MNVVERDLCMADPPHACSCGRCFLRSRLTNREVAGIEVERDRAVEDRDVLQQMVEDIANQIADEGMTGWADNIRDEMHRLGQ